MILGAGGRSELWDAEGGRRTAVLADRAAWKDMPDYMRRGEASFSPDGAVVAGARDRDLVAWAADDGRVRTAVPG